MTISKELMIILHQNKTKKMVVVCLDLDITAPQYFVDKMAVKRSEEQKIHSIRLVQHVVFYYTTGVDLNTCFTDSHEFIVLLNKANLFLDDSLKPHHYGLCLDTYYEAVAYLKLEWAIKLKRNDH